MSSEEVPEAVCSHTVNVKDAVKISFIRPLQSLNETALKEFTPPMTDKIFNGESIFGYKDLKIWIIYNDSTGCCYVKITYTSKMNSDNHIADDIWSKLRMAIPADFVKAHRAFDERQMNYETPGKYYGVPKFLFHCTYNDDEGGTESGVFMAHLCSVNEPGFREVHMRFQTLLLWYTDKLTFFDLDDPNWDIIYLYTRCGTPTPAVVGFCAYNKFQVPGNLIRARISQFIIFPQYQRRGIGLRFIRCVHSIIRESIPNLKEVSLANSNEGFRMMRAISFAQAAFQSPAMRLFFPNSREHEEFERALVVMFKITKRDAEMFADLIQYIFFILSELNVKEVVRRRVEARFSRDFFRKMRRSGYSSESGAPPEYSLTFENYWDKFVRLSRTFLEKINMNLRLARAE